MEVIELGAPKSSMIDGGREKGELDSSFHQSANTKQEQSSMLGKIYLEARLHDSFIGNPEEICRKILTVFSYDVVQHLSLALWEDLLTSEAFKGLFPEELHSLKAVEFVGDKPTNTHPPVGRVALEVHIYQMCNCHETVVDGSTLLQAETILLPNLRFEGIWERLVFDTDIQSNLVRLMTNMIKFSQKLSNANRRARMNRLLLLSGPPGTGKTTLCQALAQKLSIRLNHIFCETQLIQVNAATLLSKFFSESAKHILQVFSTIERICKSNPNQFICVLVDEIESLASSRVTASKHGEVQDTIRATNALLTGFDRVKSLPNLIILCTSNMVHALDPAFLDRCSYLLIVEPPSLAASYQILRDGIHELISAQVIESEHPVPSYRDAKLTLLTEPAKPGSVLIRLCNLVSTSAAPGGYGTIRCSARFLGQLPEVALADRLTSDSCNLDEALAHITQFVGDRIPVTLVQGEILENDLSPSMKRKREQA